MYLKRGDIPSPDGDKLFQTMANTIQQAAGLPSPDGDKLFRQNDINQNFLYRHRIVQFPKKV